jgi:hypothetical protein
MEVVFDPPLQDGPNDSAEDQFKSTKKLVICRSFGRQGLLASFPAARPKKRTATGRLLLPRLSFMGGANDVAH